MSSKQNIVLGRGRFFNADFGYGDEGRIEMALGARTLATFVFDSDGHRVALRRGPKQKADDTVWDLADPKGAHCHVKIIAG